MKFEHDYSPFCKQHDHPGELVAKLVLRPESTILVARDEIAYPTCKNERNFRQIDDEIDREQLFLDHC